MWELRGLFGFFLLRCDVLFTAPCNVHRWEIWALRWERVWSQAIEFMVELRHFCRPFLKILLFRSFINSFFFHSFANEIWSCFELLTSLCYLQAERMIKELGMSSLGNMDRASCCQCGDRISRDWGVWHGQMCLITHSFESCLWRSLYLFFWCHHHNGIHSNGNAA